MKSAVKSSFREAYVGIRRRLRSIYSQNTRMEMAVGGQFEAFGILMRELLIQTGLERDGYVIDVGCGSGRLAKPLSQYLSG
jgi:2-polyprenyl-3-methyl-5-hydroxy-6-metoxy-1,4-benzoquinol methylase